METLLDEVGAQIAVLLGNGILPLPQALPIPQRRREDVAKACRDAAGRADSLESLMYTLRAAYRNITRLRSVSRWLYHARWLLGWAELYDYVKSSLSFMSHAALFRFAKDRKIDHLLQGCQTPEDKQMAMQYIFQQEGTSMYKFVIPSNHKLIFGDAPRSWNGDKDAMRLTEQARGVVRADPDDVQFHCVGIEHHTSVTGEMRLHFLDELHYHTDFERNWTVLVREPQNPASRFHINFARIYKWDANGKRVLVPVAELKKSTLRRWAKRLAQQHKASNTLLHVLRCSVKEKKLARQRANAEEEHSKALDVMMIVDDDK